MDSMRGQHEMSGRALPIEANTARRIISSGISIVARRVQSGISMITTTTISIGIIMSRSGVIGLHY